MCVSGTKTFLLVRPTENNLRLFHEYLADPFHKSRFFGSHPGLDEGGCQSVTLRAGQAVIMPAGFIHMVETQGHSIALGINFLHVRHLGLVASEYHRERQNEKRRERHNSVPQLLLAEIIRSL